MGKKRVFLAVRIVIVSVLAVVAVFFYISKPKGDKTAVTREVITVKRLFDNPDLIIEGVLKDVNSVTVKVYPAETEENYGYKQIVIAQSGHTADDIANAVAYEVSLYDKAGKIVEPEEKFNCYIALPEEMSALGGDMYVVYRVDGNVAKEQPAYLKGKDLVVMADQNGVYMVIKLQPATSEEDEPVLEAAEVDAETDVENLPEDTETAEAGTEEQTETPSATPTPTPRPAEENPREANEETTNAQNAANGADAAQGQNTQTGYYALGRVNVRAGMSTDDAVITTLEKDTPIEVIGVAQGSEWALVKVGDRSGYVNIQYIGVR